MICEILLINVYAHFTLFGCVTVPEFYTELNSSMVGKRQKHHNKPKKEELKAISYDSRKQFLNVSKNLLFFI